MQKTLLSTTALLVAAGIAVPAFAQWTISAGVQSTQLEVESSVFSTVIPGETITTTNNSISRNDQDTSIGGELAVGYQYNFDTTYNVALEAFGQLSDAQTNVATVPTLQGEFDPKAEITWVAGLRLRPGYFVTPSTRLFIDGGVVVGGFELEQTDAAGELVAAAVNQTFSEEDVTTLWGWRYGVGVEHKVNDNFAIGVDYTVTEFDEYESTFIKDSVAVGNLEGVPGSAGASYSPTLHTLGLNFKYLFGAKKHVQHHHYEMKDK